MKSSWQKPWYYTITNHNENIGKNVLWSKSKIQGVRQHQGGSYQLLQPVKEKNSHWLHQLAGHFDNPKIASTVIHVYFTCTCVFTSQNDPNSIAKWSCWLWIIIKELTILLYTICWILFPSLLAEILALWSKLIWLIQHQTSLQGMPRLELSYPNCKHKKLIELCLGLHSIRAHPFQ